MAAADPPIEISVATIPSRLGAAVLWFGPLLLGLGSCGAGGLAAMPHDTTADVVGLVLIGLGLVVFAVGVVCLWIYLFAAAKRADLGARAWHGGDWSSAEQFCLSALRIAFRADLRTKAIHVLGLCAEARGRFGAAAELFDLARRAIPLAAAPVRKRHAAILMDSHRGLCLLACGRVDEAAARIEEAVRAMSQGDQRGLLDALTDDASWGLGSISLNTILVGIEAGRDLRAPLTLARLLLLSARGSAREVVDLVHRESEVLARGLLPREQALVTRLHADATAALGAGAHRSAALPDPGTDSAWANAVLDGLRGRTA